MTLLIKGIDRLSQLLIDADKNWNDRGITNIKQVAALMSKGDIVVRDTNILVRIQAGPDGYVLTAAGVGKLPTWAPAGGALKYYFPVFIDLSHNEAIVTVDKSHSKTTQLSSSHVQAYLDAPADNIKRLDPAVALADSEAIVTVDQSHSKNAPVASECAFEYAVGGAVLDDGGVRTDYTAEINSAAANDVKLLPDTPLVVDDAFYIGLAQPWDQVWLNIGQGGAGNWTLAEEYWDGAAWSGLGMLKDNTNQFMSDGTNQVRWTRPGDWALTTIEAMNLYWMRFRITNVINYITQPLGTQGWCEVIA